VITTCGNTATTHSDGTWAAKVHNTLDVRARRVGSSMQREAEFIDAKSDATGTDVQHITTHVHFHQTACRHLVVQHAEWRY